MNVIQDGLFSAILSAFLVAAYPNLQPSPMAVMNYNLERIATQTVSYNFTDGKLISTTPKEQLSGLLSAFKRMCVSHICTLAHYSWLYDMSTCILQVIIIATSSLVNIRVV